MSLGDSIRGKRFGKFISHEINSRAYQKLAHTFSHAPFGTKFVKLGQAGEVGAAFESLRIVFNL